MRGFKWIVGSVISLQVLLWVTVIVASIYYGHEIGAWTADRWEAASSRFDHMIRYEAE